MDTTPIHIVDDDKSVRAGLARLIKSAGLRPCVYESAEEFLNGVDAAEPACLLLDIRMPGLNGLEVQERLNSNGLNMPIIFITGHGTVPMSVEAMKEGAWDFIEKPFDDDVLLEAIQSAVAKASAEVDERDDLRRLRGLLHSLTPREFEIFRHVVSGMLNKQIAFKLEISEKTVKTHRGRVMEKMQTRALADLVRIAAKLEIPLPSKEWLALD